MTATIASSPQSPHLTVRFHFQFTESDGKNLQFSNPINRLHKSTNKITPPVIPVHSLCVVTPHACSSSSPRRRELLQTSKEENTEAFVGDADQISRAVGAEGGKEGQVGGPLCAHAPPYLQVPPLFLFSAIVRALFMVFHLLFLWLVFGFR